MRALIIGSGGMLATDLEAVLAAGGHEVRPLTIHDLDITDADAADGLISQWSSGTDSVVFNCAAYTNVDGAEADEAAAHLINAVGPANLAGACARAGADLVHISTDYVFPGDAQTPYEVDSPTGPKSAYGRTKLAGEQAVRSLAPSSYVVRTAWLYGAGGKNFVRTMASLERDRETLTVIDDQRGSPTWSRDLSESLVALASTRAYGIYHCTNSGDTTWCGFARAVFEEVGADPMRVRPCTTADYPLPAPRPAYSVLSGAALAGAGVPPMRPWRDALKAAFAEAGDAFRG
ncbi:MAG: dTDP-4-dehydrorhamnose reductase [Mycobacteriales bacterium]